MLIDSAGLLAAVLRGCQGIAWSLTFAAGMSLVADVAPPERLGTRHRPLRGRGARHQRARPAVAEPIATHFGPRPLFALSAVIGLVGAWYCRRLTTGAPCAVDSRRSRAGHGAAAPS
jgi:MFS family permease